jgi:glycosyltransferase involved in cell wall biosynthesis
MGVEPQIESAGGTFAAEPGAPAARRLRIAHVAGTDMAVRFLLLDQLLYLARQGWAVTAIASPGPHLAAVERAGIRVLRLPMTRRATTPLADLAALRALRRLFRRERFDVVHTHNPKPGLLGQLAARMAGVPVVVNTLHGFYVHDGTPRLRRRFFLALERIAALCSDVVLCQSREDLDAAVRERILPRERLRWLGNGIDLARFDPARYSLATLPRRREALGLPPAGPLIGFVGRAVAEKGVREMVTAARRVLDRVPDAGFLAVELSDSGPAERLDVEALARAAGIGKSVVVLRDREDMPDLYALMDLLWLPSYREGFPRVLMEAAAMRVPVVATDVRGCREAVRSGETGFLVPPGDAAALAEATRWMLATPGLLERLGAAAYRLAREQFDQQRVFETVREEYLRLARAKGLVNPPAPE